MGATSPEIIQRPTTAFGSREGAPPCLIVLHYTAMESAGAALERLCDPEIEVSAHYLISETGETVQMVDESERAWHAGAGRWGACDDVNTHSIGIELANRGDHPFGEPQMAALEGLLAAIMARHGIPAEHVIGHSDIAPGRKIDPGPRFDWARLARRGLSIWPLGDAKPSDFARDAAAFGYPVADVGEGLVLEAFRLRFRPWADGPVSDADRAAMAELAARWPVQAVRGEPRVKRR
ncbi:N-acetylmuramoyl-L-alanine amidase [Rhodobacteraceae bacterium D3-12]|nr:N-acetylmuramoyl-L-alanine amidase [Rhodobacteraceae bacterium D3-12]